MKKAYIHHRHIEYDDEGYFVRLGEICSTEVEYFNSISIEKGCLVFHKDSGDYTRDLESLGNVDIEILGE